MTTHTTNLTRSLTQFVIIAAATLFAQRSLAQQILFVNDNDFITYNTDTIENDLSHTMYGSHIHYWSIPDSAGTAPTAPYMANYDLVIWYASTDGVGLKFWAGSTAGTGNPEIVNYAGSGKPLWIIGSDILYQEYGATATTFAAGDFAKDVMGLSSYDVQSYVDDGSTGCPEVDRTSAAPTTFPSIIKWQFSTLWYVDGCTPNATTLAMYQMGPSSYTLAGDKCMFHNTQSTQSVMSTFFDPALIDTFVNRASFMETGITYLLGSTKTTNISHSINAKIYPNPATNTLNISFSKPIEIGFTVDIRDLTGRLVATETINSGNRTSYSTNVSNLPHGLFFAEVYNAAGIVVYREKFIKN